MVNVAVILKNIDAKGRAVYGAVIISINEEKRFVRKTKKLGTFVSATKGRFPMKN